MTFELVPAPSIEALATAGLCSALACVLSLYTIGEHLLHWSRPELQVFIVRILFIVPVYSLTSIFSLAFRSESLYFEIVRDVYEAFVLYCFLSLLLVYAGGESQCVDKMKIVPGTIRHPWPFSSLGYIQTDVKFLRHCKQAAIQFIIVKPLMAIISIIMLAEGQYHSWIYQTVLTVIYNLSYTGALYMLVLFYMATHSQLQNFNPILKFAAVKIIVFFTYWQSLIFLFIPSFSEQEAAAIIDFSLCCEMLLFAILQYFAFSPSEFKNVDGGNKMESELYQHDTGLDSEHYSMDMSQSNNSNDSEVSVSTQQHHLATDIATAAAKQPLSKQRQILQALMSSGVLDLRDVVRDTSRTFGSHAYEGYSLRSVDVDENVPEEAEGLDPEILSMTEAQNINSPTFNGGSSSVNHQPKASPTAGLFGWMRGSNKHQRLKEEVEALELDDEKGSSVSASDTATAAAAAPAPAHHDSQSYQSSPTHTVDAPATQRSALTDSVGAYSVTGEDADAELSDTER